MLLKSLNNETWRIFWFSVKYLLVDEEEEDEEEAAAKEKSNFH